jgi:hypothetical protein
MDQPTPEPAVAIVWNRDLLFGSRIRVALASLGLQPHFVKTVDQFLSALDARHDDAAIAIIDMNEPIPWEMVSSVLNSLAAAPPTIGFGPHTDVEGRRAAKAAGLTRVVSNGQFHTDMAAIIDRYRRH